MPYTSARFFLIGRFLINVRYRNIRISVCLDIYIKDFTDTLKVSEKQSAIFIKFGLCH